MYKILESIHEECGRLIREAYEEGKSDSFKSVQEDFDEIKAEAYQKGLDDAWECAKKISVAKPPQEWYEIANIFHAVPTRIYEVFNEYSASEAIDKIKEYEEKKKADDEIKVGDEVYILVKKHPKVVTAVYTSDHDGEKWASFLTASGKYCVEQLCKLHKTGRHFSQIAEVLEQMKEDGNEISD